MVPDRRSFENIKNLGNVLLNFHFLQKKNKRSRFTKVNARLSNLNLSVATELGEYVVFAEFDAVGELHANLWRRTQKDEVLDEGLTLNK